MSRNCLSLNDQQLWLIQSAAAALPVEVRDWFLRNVADWLSNNPRPTTQQVHQAVTTVLTSASIPIPPCLGDGL